MSDQQNPSRLSARGGFFLGIGTAAIIGALAFAAVRYDGTAKAVTPSAEPVAVTATTDTFPLAEHVAAMSGTTEPSTAAAMPPMQSSSKALLSGTIGLDPSIAASVSGPVTVFVIARDKTGKGHPILAKRLDVTTFPAKFTLSAGDSMMGGAPPHSVSLEARIDRDRDAMTKEPNAPSAKIETVALGTQDVMLTLH